MGRVLSRPHQRNEGGRDVRSKTVIEEIAAERQRQIDKEGYHPVHDDEHDEGELAMAAACYAAPERIYRLNEFAASMEFKDPFPWRGDKRPHNGNVVLHNKVVSKTRRRRLLVIAAALIVAEIERLDRKAV